MSRLKCLILLAFLCQLVACGQKGALILTDEKDESINESPPKVQPVKAEQKENSK